MGVAVDATLFIDVARGRSNAIAKLEEIDSRTDLTVIPAPVAYELLFGILRRKSMTQTTLFRGWLSRFHVAPLDLPSAERAAAIRHELARLGRTKGTGDVLSAGIALAGNHSFVTRDSDFHQIAAATGLLVEPY